MATAPLFSTKMCSYSKRELKSKLIGFLVVTMARLWCRTLKKRRQKSIENEDDVHILFESALVEALCSVVLSLTGWR